MELNIQILSLTFSFIFGFLFSFFLNLNLKIIFSKNKFIKFLGTFLIILLSTLLYFIGLYKINNAIFHPYELFMIILGFYIENKCKKNAQK